MPNQCPCTPCACEACACQCGPTCQCGEACRCDAQGAAPTAED